MAAPTIQSALLYYLRRPGLTEADRAHLNRWLAEVMDPVWEQIAADIKRYGELPPLIEGYPHFIGPALRARQSAESTIDSPSLLRKREQQRQQQERADLVALAVKMDEVVRDYRRFQTRSPRPPRPPRPPRSPRPPWETPSPEEVRWREAQRSLEWLEQEAQKVRPVADRPNAEPATWDWDRVRVHVSRQRGGRGRRSRSRELRLFMQRMVNFMYQACGKPRYHAVATITNIAFPDANAVAENVRSACRPTTRVGRRRTTGALRK
jgi:hypothetical protein